MADLCDLARRKDAGDYCGCCGLEPVTADDYFCPRCLAHVEQSTRAPWDRTYFARRGKDCPRRKRAARG